MAALGGGAKRLEPPSAEARSVLGSGSAPGADLDPVPPRQDQRRSEQRERHQAPEQAPALEGADEDGDVDQGQEQEEGEGDPPAELAEEAAPEEERGGGREDEDDAEIGLQEACFSLAASFAITLWCRP